MSKYQDFNICQNCGVRHFKYNGHVCRRCGRSQREHLVADIWDCCDTDSEEGGGPPMEAPPPIFAFPSGCGQVTDVQTPQSWPSAEKAIINAAALALAQGSLNTSRQLFPSGNSVNVCGIGFINHSMFDITVFLKDINNNILFQCVFPPSLGYLTVGSPYFYPVPYGTTLSLSQAWLAVNVSVISSSLPIDNIDIYYKEPDASSNCPIIPPDPECVVRFEGISLFVTGFGTYLLKISEKKFHDVDYFVWVLNDVNPPVLRNFGLFVSALTAKRSYGGTNRITLTDVTALDPLRSIVMPGYVRLVLDDPYRMNIVRFCIFVKNRSTSNAFFQVWLPDEDNLPVPLTAEVPPGDQVIIVHSNYNGIKDSFWGGPVTTTSFMCLMPDCTGYVYDVFFDPEVITLSGLEYHFIQRVTKHLLCDISSCENSKRLKVGFHPDRMDESPYVTDPDVARSDPSTAITFPTTPNYTANLDAAAYSPALFPIGDFPRGVLLTGFKEFVNLVRIPSPSVDNQLWDPLQIEITDHFYQFKVDDTCYFTLEDDYDCYGFYLYFVSSRQWDVTDIPLRFMITFYTQYNQVIMVYDWRLQGISEDPVYFHRSLFNPGSGIDSSLGTAIVLNYRKFKVERLPVLDYSDDVPVNIKCIQVDSKISKCEGKKPIQATANCSIYCAHPQSSPEFNGNQFLRKDDIMSACPFVPDMWFQFEGLVLGQIFPDSIEILDCQDASNTNWSTVNGDGLSIRDYVTPCYIPNDPNDHTDYSQDQPHFDRVRIRASAGPSGGSPFSAKAVRINLPVNAESITPRYDDPRYNDVYGFGIRICHYHQNLPEFLSRSIAKVTFFPDEAPGATLSKWPPGYLTVSPNIQEIMTKMYWFENTTRQGLSPDWDDTTDWYWLVPQKEPGYKSSFPLGRLVKYIEIDILNNVLDHPQMGYFEIDQIIVIGGLSCPLTSVVQPAKNVAGIVPSINPIPDPLPIIGGIVDPPVIPKPPAIMSCFNDTPLLTNKVCSYQGTDTTLMNNEVNTQLWSSNVESALSVVQPTDVMSVLQVNPIPFHYIRDKPLYANNAAAATAKPILRSLCNLLPSTYVSAITNNGASIMSAGMLSMLCGTANDTAYLNTNGVGVIAVTLNHPVDIYSFAIRWNLYNTSNDQWSIHFYHSAGGASLGSVNDAGVVGDSSEVDDLNTGWDLYHTRFFPDDPSVMDDFDGPLVKNCSYFELDLTSLYGSPNHNFLKFFEILVKDAGTSIALPYNINDAFDGGNQYVKGYSFQFKLNSLKDFYRFDIYSRFSEDIPLVLYHDLNFSKVALSCVLPKANFVGKYGTGITSCTFESRNYNSAQTYTDYFAIEAGSKPVDLNFLLPVNNSEIQYTAYNGKPRLTVNAFYPGSGNQIFYNYGNKIFLRLDRDYDFYLFGMMLRMGSPSQPLSIKYYSDFHADNIILSCPWGSNPFATNVYACWKGSYPTDSHGTPFVRGVRSITIDCSLVTDQLFRINAFMAFVLPSGVNTLSSAEGTYGRDFPNGNPIARAVQSFTLDFSNVSSDYRYFAMHAYLRHSICPSGAPITTLPQTFGGLNSCSHDFPTESLQFIPYDVTEFEAGYVNFFNSWRYPVSYPLRYAIASDISVSLLSPSGSTSISGTTILVPNFIESISGSIYKVTFTSLLDLYYMKCGLRHIDWVDLLPEVPMTFYDADGTILFTDALKFGDGKTVNNNRLVSWFTSFSPGTIYHDDRRNAFARAVKSIDFDFTSFSGDTHWVVLGFYVADSFCDKRGALGVSNPIPIVDPFPPVVIDPPGTIIPVLPLKPTMPFVALPKLDYLWSMTSPHIVPPCYDVIPRNPDGSSSNGGLYTRSTVPGYPIFDAHYFRPDKWPANQFSIAVVSDVLFTTMGQLIYSNSGNVANFDQLSRGVVQFDKALKLLDGEWVDYIWPDMVSVLFLNFNWQPKYQSPYGPIIIDLFDENDVRVQPPLGSSLFTFSPGMGVNENPLYWNQCSYYSEQVMHAFGGIRDLHDDHVNFYQCIPNVKRMRIHGRIGSLMSVEVYGVFQGGILK